MKELLLKFCQYMVSKNTGVARVTQTIPNCSTVLINFLTQKASLSIAHFIIKKALTTTYLGAICYSVLEFTIFNSSLYSPLKMKIDKILEFIQKPGNDIQEQAATAIINAGSTVIADATNHVAGAAAEAALSSVVPAVTVTLLEVKKYAFLDSLLTVAGASTCIGIGCIVFLFGGPIMGSTYIVGVGTKCVLVKVLAVASITGKPAFVISTGGALVTSAITHRILKNTFKEDIVDVDIKHENIN